MKNDIQILTERQLEFLKEIGQNSYFAENFYLTGGTALAGFYLYHRYSEDLDFFSEKEIDILPLDAFMGSVRNKLRIKNIDFQQSFNRNLFFLHYEDGEILKTEFTYYPFQRIEKGIKKFGISIDSLIDISVNKLFTIYQRSQIKDYIDLYLICKEKNFSIDGLIKQAKIKFDWDIDLLQLGTQFIKVQDLKDMPSMVGEVSFREMVNFFIDEAKKLKIGIVV